MSYSEGEIAERNRDIDALCARIQPLVQQVFASAVARQTATESTEVLVEEAKSALRELLAQPENESRLEDGSRGLKQLLATALAQESVSVVPEPPNEWVERRSKDLARALVGFWINLGEDFVARYRASVALLDDMVAANASVQSRNLATLYSRYWLDAAEAQQLLRYVEALAAMAPVARAMDASLEPGAIEQLLAQLEPQPANVSGHTVEFNIELPMATELENNGGSEQMRALVKAMDRVNQQQLQLIRREGAAFRARRIGAMQVGVELTRIAVARAIAFSKVRGAADQ
jgi:hypothetical protein